MGTRARISSFLAWTLKWLRWWGEWAVQQGTKTCHLIVNSLFLRCRVIYLRQYRRHRSWWIDTSWIRLWPSSMMILIQKICFLRQFLIKCIWIYLRLNKRNFWQQNRILSILKSCLIMMEHQRFLWTLHSSTFLTWMGHRSKKGLILADSSVFQPSPQRPEPGDNLT